MDCEENLSRTGDATEPCVAPGAATGESAITVGGAVARGSLWSLGGNVATLFASMVATPFILRVLHPALYGLWSLLQSTLRWVGLADLGMASASTRLGARHYQAGDGRGEAEVVWTALAITVSLTACAAGCVALAGPFILRTLLHIRPQLAGPGVLALRIICVACVVRSVAGTINTPQLVRLRWKSFTIATSGPSLIQIVSAPIVLAVAQGGVVALAVVALSAALLGAAGNLAVASRLQPGILKPRVSCAVARPLLSYGAPLTLGGVAAIPLTTAERLLLARYKSATVVAHYAVAATVGSLLSVIPAAAVAPLFPALVRLDSSGERDAYRALYRRALVGTFTLLTPSAMVLAFLAHPFLTDWAGPEYGQDSSGPLYVILIGAWFNSLAYLPYWHLLASGRTGLVARIHLVVLGPYVVLAAVLTARFGAMGAAAVWSLRVVSDSVAVFVFAWRQGRLPYSPFSRRVGASIIAPCSLAAVLVTLGGLVNGLSQRSGCALAAAGLYAVLVWKLVLLPGERATAKAMAVEVAPRLTRGLAPATRRSRGS